MRRSAQGAVGMRAVGVAAADRGCACGSRALPLDHDPGASTGRRLAAWLAGLFDFEAQR